MEKGEPRKKQQIAERVGRIGHHIVGSSATAEPIEAAPSEDDDRRAILKLLHRRTGVDFAEYRHGTVRRRILRRMLVHRQATSSEYLALVRRDAPELDRLYEDLLIGAHATG